MFRLSIIFGKKKKQANKFQDEQKHNKLNQFKIITYDKCQLNINYQKFYLLVNLNMDLEKSFLFYLYYKSVFFCFLYKFINTSLKCELF